MSKKDLNVKIDALEYSFGTIKGLKIQIGRITEEQWKEPMGPTHGPSVSTLQEPDKKHQIVDTWKPEEEKKPAPVAQPLQSTMQQISMAGFTVPSLELPASILPMSGLPQGVNFKIILKNVKIKAETVIIRAEKE